MINQISRSLPLSRTRLGTVTLITMVVSTVFIIFPPDARLAATSTQTRKDTKTTSSPRDTADTTTVSAATRCAPISKVSFSDDKFVMADWETAVLPGNALVPGYTATQVATGGAPADFRSVQITTAPGTSARHFIHLLKGYVFDPAKEGAIVSIDGSYNLKNLSRTDASATFALLLFQNGGYYRGPIDSFAAAQWSMFNHQALKAADFVNLSREGPPNPTFTCDGKPIQMGFVALAGREINSGIDNWSVNFNSTCCNAVTGGDRSVVNASTPRGSALSASILPGRRTEGAGVPTPTKEGTGPREERDKVTSRCCCDDNEVPVDKNGTVVLPPNVDMDSPPNFEYVDQELGDVADLYPGADTTLDTWCQKYPCKPAIGGAVPNEAENPDIDIQLQDKKVDANTEEINKEVTAWEKEIAEKEAETARKWKGPAAPKYTPPGKPYSPPNKPGIKYAFGGRDIVFVHGLKLEHVLDRIQGKPEAQVNWKQPTSFPASTDNPEFYTGYYKKRAELTWRGSSHFVQGGHIEEFLRSKGYYNRYLVVSYNCSERLDVAVRSILAQIGDAMTYGTGVVDPANLTGPPPRNFGTPSFVIVSHSTGGLVTDVALTAAAQIPSLQADYIPKYCKAHIAAHGAHRGSRLATAAIVLSGYTATAAPSWLWPMLWTILGQIHPPASNIPTSPYGFQTFASSILLDLVPSVAQQRWGPYIHDVPVRTLTVVGAHPTFLRPFKFVLLPGFDDGVANIDSQAANPNNNLVWPSGFRTNAAGLGQNFDLGVFGLGQNFSVPVSIGGNLVNFSVNISNTSLNSPSRAVNYYVNQKIDRISSPGNVLGFPQPFFFASGATPYISPTGMLQTIEAEYASGSGAVPLSANPLNRNPNIFSFLQSASDHFKGTHDQVMGFNGVLYGNSPIYDTANGERNFEETRVITDSAVYASYAMPYGDNQPLLRPQNLPPVKERIRGLRVTFTIKFFKKKWTKTYWVWKRRYHLLDEWETKRQFDYVYESVLKN
jgi:hypothetical protein